MTIRNSGEKHRRFKTTLKILILLSPAVYMSSCTYISIVNGRAFDLVQTGDKKATVLAQFGSPSVQEGHGKAFARYSSVACTVPCVERLWFENKLILGVEAWSIDIGGDGRVVHTAHWVFP